MTQKRVRACIGPGVPDLKPRATGVIQPTIKAIFALFLVLIASFAITTPANADVPRAYAGIVVDAKTGNTLYSYAADSLRYPASVTKVMTLYMLFLEIKAGRMTMNTPLSVSDHAAAAVPTKLYVRPGTTIKVRDAIGALITLSANDVARVIAENIAGTESAFAQRMTATARALGMDRTTYANASGLPDRRQVTTVRDQARLAMAMFQHFPEYYELFSMRSFTYRGKTYGNHNRLLGQNGVDGLKTGYIRASGYNLLTSARANGRHIVVAGFGFSSGASRNAKVAELVQKYLGRARRGDYWAQAKIPFRGTANSLFPGNVFAVAASEPVVPMPRPAGRDITKQQIVPETATAVIEQVAPQPLGQSQTVIASLQPSEQPLALMAPTPEDPRNPQGTPQPIALVPDITVTGTVAPQPQPRPLDIIGEWLNQSFSAPVNGQPAPPLPVGVANLAPPANVGIDPNHSGAIGDPVQTTPSQPASTWVVQVGAAPNENAAQQLLGQASTRLNALQDFRPYVEKFENVGQTFYRARFAGFADRDAAVAMCNRIKQSNMSCLAVQS